MSELNKSYLPAACKSWPVLEAWGVERIADDGNGLFVAVNLPLGWRTTGTPSELDSDGAQVTHLLDQHGRERANLFYKGTIVNGGIVQTPRMRVECRFKLSCRRNEESCSVTVLDAGQVIHQTNEISIAGLEPDAEWTALSALYQQAHDWLSASYPEWRNVSAYWDW